MKNIPNILTILRLLACPLLVYLFTVANYLWILIIFVLACLTDFFDGYLARKKNFKSNFGKVLDPIADKLLIITMCILIIIYHDIGVIEVAFYIIIIREIAVSLLRFNLANDNENIDVSLLSKYKTFFQMIAIGGFVIVYGIKWNKFNWTFELFTLSFSQFFIWFAAFITVITGMQHFKTFLKLKK